MASKSVLDSDEQAYVRWRDANFDDPVTELELARVLRRYARSIVYQVLHRDDRELVTDIVTHAFQQAHTFKGRSKFMTWFYRLATRLCLMELRKRRRRRECSIESYQDLVSGLEMPGHGVCAAATVARLMKILTGPDRVLLQAKLEDLTRTEIAERMGVSVREMNRAWKRLRERLQRLLAAKSFGA